MSDIISNENKARFEIRLVFKFDNLNGLELGKILGVVIWLIMRHVLHYINLVKPNASIVILDKRRKNKISKSITLTWLQIKKTCTNNCFVQTFTLRLGSTSYG